MAQRARMIVSGNFAVEKALKENKVKMLIITSDTSEKTIKEYEKTAMEKDIPLKIDIHNNDSIVLLNLPHSIRITDYALPDYADFFGFLWSYAAGGFRYKPW